MQVPLVSDLIESVAKLIAECAPANGSTRALGWREVQELAFARGIVTPTHGSRGRISEGTVKSAFRLARALGYVAWATAWIARYHFDTRPEPGQPVVMRQLDGSYRLPPRMIALGRNLLVSDDSRGPMQKAHRENSLETSNPADDAVSAFPRVDLSTLHELQRRL